ncbi:hypothetical protein C2S53_017909 [Perilla frutescens var. hirtella]|uniref:Cytochrome P450 n=1 Tax=Perilla frutescens var. hirtella TaxID=608512 RepID=A0AAD4JJE4_PERFH|nr:hypothetical protein C2S53_017909 [Perilla frutescens var. hirtella]
MDMFMHYYLPPLLLLPLSLYLIFFIRKKGSDDLKNLPPGSKGWPILGENVELALLGYQRFVRERMQKYSPEVFKTSLLGEKTAVFCSAQGNKFLFSNENKLVTYWLPQSIKKALLPEFFESDCKEALVLFHKLQYDALKPEALKQYVRVMDSLARELLEKDWRPNSVVKVFPSSKKYTFELVCRVFLNVEGLHKLVDPFTLLGNGMVSLPIDLPGTAFNRAIKAGKVVRGELLKIVKERRKELMMMIENKESEGGDMLSKIMMLSDEDGKQLSDAKVANFFVSLLMASFESTASAITSVMNFLAQIPHIYDKVFKEQMEIAKSKGPNEMLTWEDVEKMEYSWNVARETLRLAPPAQGAFRVATAEFTYAGFTIPKGWKTFWTVHASHTNPDYFPEPEKFDPSRFEGTGPPPYTFVPFGGGPKMCSGRDFAKLAILVFMHNVVTKFRLEKAIPNEKMLFHSRLTPAHGLCIHLYPHTK